MDESDLQRDEVAIIKVLSKIYIYIFSGTEKYELFSQATYNSQKLNNKSLAINSWSWRVNIFKFADLGMN